MRIIDLTGLIEEGMWTYGSPLPEVSIRKLIHKNGVVSYAITLGSIAGTYLETAAHWFENAPSLDDVPPERLITDAVVVKLRAKGPLEHIELDELSPYKSKVRKGDALLVSTSWDSKWHEGNFISESPHFSREAMDWVLDRKVSILGGDIPCYDDPRKSEGLVKKLFSRGILILAPLINVRKIRKERVKLMALTPRIKGTCAFPCRAIAIEAEDAKGARS